MTAWEEEALPVAQGKLRKAGWIELRLWIPGCQEESGMLDFSTDEEEAGREETCDDHLSVHHPREPFLGCIMHLLRIL